MLKIENAEGTVLAFLNNLTEAKVKEVLNGEYTLSFVATIDHLKTDYLYDNTNLINYNDDLFRVISFEELHDEDDALTVEVECEHISYDLINSKFLDFNYTYRTAADVMAQCLLGTGFTLRTCNITEKTDIQYTEECNAKQISIAIANNWHGELKYYRHYIDLLKNRGANRGVGFIFGKNLKSVKRIKNFAENTLSYEVEIVEGTETEELGYYELGDTVRVIDERMGLDYECKIIELEKDILTGLNSSVVLGDSIKDMRSEFSRSKEYADKVADKAADEAYNKANKESAPYWEKLNAILNNLGNVIAGKLQGDLSLATTNILNSTGTFEQRDNGLYWQDQPTKAASTFATFWSAQGIMFARSKDSNGEWVWESALTADGLIATSVTSSCLSALQASILNLTAGSLTGKTITGVTIEGGTIYCGNRATGNYTEIDDTGNIRMYFNGEESLVIPRYGSGQIRLYTPGEGGLVGVALTPNDEVQRSDHAVIRGFRIRPFGTDGIILDGNVYYTGNMEQWR